MQHREDESAGQRLQHHVLCILPDMDAANCQSCQMLRASDDAARRGKSNFEHFAAIGGALTKIHLMARLLQWRPGVFGVAAMVYSADMFVQSFARHDEDTFVKLARKAYRDAVSGRTQQIIARAEEVAATHLKERERAESAGIKATATEKEAGE